MARANLNLDQGVIDAFLAAQDARDVRLIVVKIREEALVLDGVHNKAGTAEDDFNTLLSQHLRSDEASFAIFCLSDDVAGGLHWTLVAWIPDGCRVRDKMLYSSSREDLRRGLGAGYFESEFGASLPSDLRWEAYQESQRRDNTAEILSETERLVLEEKVMSQAESGNSKASALNVIPFEVQQPAQSAFAEFASGSANWVELTLQGESVVLVQSRVVSSAENLSDIVSKDIATFVLISLPDSSGKAVSIFLFSCPENVPIRMKMVMSSAKATVSGVAREHGLVFDRNLEIRDIADVDSNIKFELTNTGDASPVSPVVSAAVSKPQRPGKGRAKVAKFQSDE